jgi:hypothetical protein
MDQRTDSELALGDDERLKMSFGVGTLEDLGLDGMSGNESEDQDGPLLSNWRCARGSPEGDQLVNRRSTILLSNRRRKRKTYFDGLGPEPADPSEGSSPDRKTRLIPNPPALVDSKNSLQTPSSSPASLNSFIWVRRRSCVVEPSIRQIFQPLYEVAQSLIKEEATLVGAGKTLHLQKVKKTREGKFTSRMSSCLVNCEKTRTLCFRAKRASRSRLRSSIW